MDDEPHVISGLQDVLRDRPYEILGATSAAAALDVLRVQPVDVIVADELMPSMTGSQLLCIVAREFPTVGRIVLTGHPTVAAAVRAINEAGVVRILLKPCTPDVFCAAIDAALSAGTRGVAKADRYVLRSDCEVTAGAVRNLPKVDVPKAQDLLPFAQKIVRLKHPAVPCGYELLTAVRAKDGGIHTLSGVVSGANHRQVLPSIDRQVVRHVAEMLEPHAGVLRTLGITVSLSLSVHSLSDANFVRFLCATLSHSDIGPSMLIQTSERLTSAVVYALREPLRTVCGVGCRLVVDAVHPDALAFPDLAGLSVAWIKIDRHLIDDALTNPCAAAKIRALVLHAKQAEIGTAAAFVATGTVATALRRLGVEYGQGNAFGTPEPFATILRSFA